MQDERALPTRRQRMAALSAVQRELLERLARLRLPRATTDIEQSEAAVERAAARAGLSGHQQRVRTFYDEVSANLDAGPLGPHALFLNYGYEDLDHEHIAAPGGTARSLNRSHIRLVLEVIGDRDLTGCDILDVGCGRGGTIDVISRRAAPRRIVGVDLSTRAIRFCRSRGRPNVSVLESDAERLPFREASFDVVTNIESSHCYSDLEGFYGEVRRVLRVGGRFLYADVLPSCEMNDWLERLGSSGFVREYVRDITAHVLRSCRETAALHARAFAEHAAPRDLPEFVGLPESNVYRQMETGATSYQIWRLRRTALD